MLHKDLLEYKEYVDEKMKEIQDIRNKLFNNMKELVNQILPDYDIKIFGSHSTGLCLPWSDLDLVIISKSGFNDINALRKISMMLPQQNWIKTFKFIEHTTIPIIKIVTSDIFSEMQIDLSVQNNKHYGLKCVDLVKSFLEEYEVLDYLVLALKNILRNADLNDPFKGGISSYGLILLVVSFLQAQVDRQFSIKLDSETNNLGRLFYNFLYYYGNYFDYTKFIINTRCKPQFTDNDDMVIVRLLNYRTFHLIMIL